MASLEEIKEFCKGKSIIIVGNSSRLLNERHGKLIDSYDIVVRINKGYFHRQNFYSDKIGNKTTILSLGLKSATMSANVIQANTVKYLISPIIHSERLDYANVYDVQENTYNDLKLYKQGQTFPFMQYIKGQCFVLQVQLLGLYIQIKINKLQQIPEPDGSIFNRFIYWAVFITPKCDQPG